MFVNWAMEWNINSLGFMLSNDYLGQWTGSALLQIMACRLFGAKPLPEAMLAYCKLGHKEQISVKFESKF